MHLDLLVHLLPAWPRLRRRLTLTAASYRGGLSPAKWSDAALQTQEGHQWVQTQDGEEDIQHTLPGDFPVTPAVVANNSGVLNACKNAPNFDAKMLLHVRNNGPLSVWPIRRILGRHRWIRTSWDTATFWHQAGKKFFPAEFLPFIIFKGLNTITKKSTIEWFSINCVTSDSCPASKC